MLEHTPIILQSHAAEVILIIQDIFEDIENVELFKAKQELAENFDDEQLLLELETLHFQMRDEEEDENTGNSN